MQKLVVFSGAGMSAESGLSTFRDNNGLWEQYSVYEVATPEAWNRNRELVMDFYNQRRKQLLDVTPNDAHKLLVDLERHYSVKVITQNIDDLHERAGSSEVLHLHGELRKARSTVNDHDLYDIDGWELKIGDKCSNGSQLRPHVVWFGEAVPKMMDAELIAQQADILIVIGTSLNVYPAANILYYVADHVPIVVIDPADMELGHFKNCRHIKSGAADGLRLWMRENGLC